MAYFFSPKPHHLFSSLIAFSSLFGGNVLAEQVTTLTQQRALYDQAQKLLDNKKVDEYKAMRPQIESYPLTPYVDYRSFLVGLDRKTPQEVQTFIDSYQDFPFSYRIRAPYLDALAKEKNWSTLAKFQQVEPKGETYRCHYFQAQFQVGNVEKAFAGAQKLWLSGHSIADACDPLFEAWDNAGHKTDQLILQRMLLAFESRNGRLMNFLVKQLNSKDAKKAAALMKDLYRKPESVMAFSKSQTANDFNRKQATIALKKLARSDIDKALALYPKVLKQLNFNVQDGQKISDYIAFRLINTDSSSMAAWRDEAISKSESVSLVERRVRLAIQNADWKGVTQWIGQLPESTQQSIRWQYWLGRSEIKLGSASEGHQRLSKLIGQRNFYSVAAATAVKQSIDYPTTTFELDKSVVKQYKTALVRIQELIDRDKIAAAKSEWRWLLSRADLKDKQMLAAYASEQRWHHLSVTASISAKLWDNTQLRFPIAHQWWFNFYGEKHQIDPITLMSLARQESAMDVEARSPVGARGIMQIMPTTAKYTAKKYKLTYSGEDELYKVGKNIEIGSHYLNGLLEQYDNNRIFAFAAYNAGPTRVKQWRQRTNEQLDAYSFIEAIPFKETRGYVQNILMFETYYRDLMGVDGAFLEANEANTKY